jgi:hypothetical protein
MILNSEWRSEPLFTKKKKMLTILIVGLLLFIIGTIVVTVGIGIANSDKTERYGSSGSTFIVYPNQAIGNEISLIGVAFLFSGLLLLIWDATLIEDKKRLNN